MEEIFFHGDSGNIYQIIHGWFKRNYGHCDEDLYFFSWMKESTKGRSCIIPKKTKIKKWGHFTLSTLLNYEPTQVEAEELLTFIHQEFQKK